MAENGISIGLSKAQVTQVLRQAGDEGVWSLLKGATVPQSTDNPRLSRSFLRGLQVLAAFTDGQEHMVTQIAVGLDMGQSTTYRYVQTLVEVGLIEQNPVTREYRLVR
jgi:hypothetical protein